MASTDPYRNLRFEQQPQVAIPRWCIVLGCLALFTLLWLVVSHNVLYWILLPVLALLLWVASFGWRKALRGVHELIHWLEEL